MWTKLLQNAWAGLQPHVTDPMAWLGAAGTGLGIYDIIRQQKLEKDYLRRQRDWQSQVANIANAPLNVEAIFNPGKELIQRDLEAGLAERGMQPGGAWGAAMGEGMMRKWLEAAQIAQAQRGNQLSALTGVGPVRPQFPGVGRTDALGKYLQSRREAEAARSARGEQQTSIQELIQALRGVGSGTGGFDSSIPDWDLETGSTDLYGSN